MRKTIIALRIIFYSLLYAIIWTTILNFSWNYRQIHAEDNGWLFGVMFMCFYLFGVYISADIYLLFSNRERDFVSSILIDSSIVCWGLSFLIIIFIRLFPNLFIIELDPDVPSVYFAFVGVMSLLLQPIVIRLSCEFEFNKYPSLRYSLKKIATVLLINLIMLFVVCINNFPGVNAPNPSRQDVHSPMRRYF